MRTLLGKKQIWDESVIVRLDFSFINARVTMIPNNNNYYLVIINGLDAEFERLHA
jgi:hypothetical protein